MATRRKHWTQTIEGKKRQSQLQKARWDKHRAEKSLTTNGTSRNTYQHPGKELTLIIGIMKSVKKLSPAGVSYVKERLNH